MLFISTPWVSIYISAKNKVGVTQKVTPVFPFVRKIGHTTYEVKRSELRSVKSEGKTVLHVNSRKIFRFF